MKIIFGGNHPFTLPTTPQHIFPCQNHTDLDNYIIQLVAFHLKQPHFLEYEIIDQPSNLSIDKKNDQFPLLTLISTFSNDTLIMQTEIDEESYKYKDIPINNTFFLVVPDQFSFVIIDSSKYYGIITPHKYIKINAYSHDTAFDITSYTKYTDFNYIDHPTIQQINNVYDNNIFENILYNTTENTSYLQQLLQPGIINTVFEIKNNGIQFDINYLHATHGDIVYDILDAKNNLLKPSNRFFNNKIVKNIYSIDVCYWIINSSEKIKWENSKYSLYDKTVDTEKLPHVLNFLIYSSTIWMIHFKKIYNITNNIKINISDIFIAKHNKQFSVVYNDKPRFVCMVQLNDSIDFKGGTIHINNIETKINQGEMLIYNSLQNIKYDNIEDGEIYYLYFFIDIGF